MPELEPFEVIDAIIAAWKQGDVEAVLAHLTEDVEMIYAIGQKPLQGKAEVREMLSKLGGNQSDVRWRVLNRARAGDVVFVEGIDDYVNAAGHRVRHVASAVQIRPQVSSSLRHSPFDIHRRHT